MSDIYQASGTADWVAEERKRKKKQNRADAPYDPNTGYAGPQTGINGPNRADNPIDVAGTPGPAPSVQGPSGLGGFPATTSTGGGSAGTSTDPAEYDRMARAATLNPFPGSFVSTLPGMGKNPYSMPAFARSPILIANQLLGNKYGLPAGSNVAGAMATYFDPQAKSLGMGFDQLSPNADWINFGAQLMQSLQGNGQQFDPKTMMANAVQAVMAEVQSMAAGGKGTSAKYSGPLGELAHEEPGQALNDFASLMQGMLAGTMPDDEINGYINFLKRSGQSFLQEFYTSHDAAADEAAGISFISFLVQKLGPSLGL